jgi:signal transduction histidine kinase
MNYVIEVLLEMMELCIIHKYMMIFFDKLSVKKYMEITAYLFKTIILMGIIQNIAYYPLVNLGATLVCLFLIAMCYYGNILRKIWIVFIICICKLLSEVIVAAVLGITGFQLFEKSIQIDNFMTLIIEVIYWLLAVILSQFQNTKKEVYLPATFRIISILVQVCTVGLFICIFHQENVSSQVTTFALCISIVSNFLIIYLYDILSRFFSERIKSEKIKNEKQYYIRQAELLQLNETNLRQFRHDIKNKLLAIGQMLDKGNYLEAEDYTKQIIGKLEHIKMYSQTGNVVFDSIVNYKLAEAENYDISVTADIIVPENLDISGDDLVIILGNLLDNAIEAAKDIKIERKIWIKIRYEKECIIFCIRNTYEKKIREREGVLLTQKQDIQQHGIGLQSVDTVIEKYHGSKHICYDDKQFEIDIILPVG